MATPLPLFPGLPGGPEILVVLLIFGLLGALVVFLVGAFVRGSSNDREVERLERRVEELERQQNDDRD